MIGGDTLVGAGLGQCGLLLALAQLQVEQLPVLLNVVQPFWLKVTGKTKSIVMVP